MNFLPHAMRYNLQLTGNTAPVPYNHLHRLTGALHKWLGPGNDLHDEMSLYSFGALQGAAKANGSLHFERGAAWRISFHDPEAARRALAGILRDPEVCCGMRVFEVQEQPVPAFNGCFRFLLDGNSPVIARRKREDGSREYLLWDHPNVDAVLTGILRNKLEKAGMSAAHGDAVVQFDRTYPRPKTSLLEVKGIRHRGSICPVVVTGTPEAVRFAWLVGIGELTGSGFGALR